MDVIKTLKRKEKQVNNEISQLLDKKDTLSQAIMYHLVNQSIHKHQPQLSHKMHKSNPSSVKHHLNSKHHVNHHGKHNPKHKSRYNHLYYLKHQDRIKKRAKIRRKFKKEHKYAKANQNTKKTHKKSVNKIANNIPNKVNWRDNNNPF